MIEPKWTVRIVNGEHKVFHAGEEVTSLRGFGLKHDGDGRLVLSLELSPPTLLVERLDARGARIGATVYSDAVVEPGEVEAELEKAEAARQDVIAQTSHRPPPRRR